jgi:hypothetical protein
MTAPAHSVRNSLADKERSFTLGPDALHWSDAGGEGRTFDPPPPALLGQG